MKNNKLQPRADIEIGVFNPEGVLKLLQRKDLIVIPVLLKQP